MERACCRSGEPRVGGGIWFEFLVKVVDQECRTMGSLERRLLENRASSFSGLSEGATLGLAAGERPAVGEMVIN